MAFVVAALPYITAAAAVAGGVMASNQQRQAGAFQQIQLKQEAEGEADAARGREIERRRALVRSLASQNASAGSRGVQTDGSIGLIARTDINDASNDLLYDRNNSASRIRALTAQGANARRVGNARANATLLDTAKVASGYKG